LFGPFDNFLVPKLEFGNKYTILPDPHSMNSAIEIQPVTGPIHGSIRPPGSKSITNRALVCAALARGESTLTGALDSEDTRVMIEALRELGIALEHDVPGKSIRITGCGGCPAAAEANLFTANSGTTIRFLTAMVALGRGRFRLDGMPRMRERPIQDLLDALNQLGAKAYSELENGCPPVVVEAVGLKGGRVTIAGDISSQFLSGLLMAAACAEKPVELMLQGRLVSQPYIAMTAAVMEAFGVSVQTEGGRFIVPAGADKNVCPPGYVGYRGRRYEIEPDASAASYFFAAAAITGGKITVEGLSRSSLQGDVAFCDCLAQMGCTVEYAENSIIVCGGKLHGIEVDMNAISDTVQTLSAAALFAEGQTTITGVAHIRHKETDRIHALAVELRKLGAEVEERPDGLRIIPGKPLGAKIETYNDHRMAMSLALAGLVTPGVVILDPGCTAKTYPEFFADLERLTHGAKKTPGVFTGG
jgi:3-phosphoshikimate 1-carboxyvinyltransferase